jgi:hypothetical protein
MNQQITDLLKLQMVMGGLNGVKSFIMVSVFEKAMSTFPVWSGYLNCRRPRRQEAPPPNKEIRAEILFERHKEDKKVQATFFQNRMDAVLHSISRVPAICRLLSITHHDYIPHEFDPVMIDTDLYFQLKDIRHSEGHVEGLKFRIFCYDNEAIFLQKFVESCTADYDRHMANKLGTHKYFFNMMVQSKSKSTMQNPLPTSHIMFTKHKFQTSRTFDNVFFEQKDNVQDHTEFFLKRKDWYDAKGIPHTLGFMFHGDPGCGKTSTIKAVANVGRRHIINIHLSEIKSKEQLSNLFFNDDINVLENGKTDRYTIPVNERMYVIEDIDAMGDTVLRREWKKPDKKKIEMDEFGNIKEEDNPIDLSFLLNLLDGTLESSGRIIAISTNFPERIDRALIRPGRIDMIVNFKKCSLRILREMVESFYDEKIDSLAWTDESLIEKWTPAEVNQILFRNFKNKDEALVEICALTPHDLYGFTLAPEHKSA